MNPRKFDVYLPPERIKRESHLWSNRILSDYVAEHAVRRPDHTAVVEIHPTLDILPKDKKNAYVLTYGQLWREARFLALRLCQAGIKPGDVVSIQLPNWADFVVFDLALTRIGGVTNPIATIYRSKEMSFFLRHSESKAVVIPTHFRGFNHLEMIEQIQTECRDLEFVWTIGDRSLPTSIDPPYASPEDPDPMDSDLGPPPEPNDVKAIVFTAGTTGEAKGVLYTHNTVDFIEKALAEAINLTPDDVFWFPSTLGHGTGYVHGYIGAMRLGSTLVLPDKWDRYYINETLKRWHCTYTLGATPFLIDTVENGSDEALDCLRIFLCGGAYIPIEVMRRAKERMPHCTILRGWGQTENSTVTVTRPGDPIEKIITTDGRPNLFKEVQVRDQSTGKILPVGTEGELWTRGPSLAVGYHRRPDLTRESMDEKGWFRTGDRGKLDAEGYLTITGRVKDIIIRGGENFPVKQMEDLLSTHPAVTEIAIVAMPDTRLQEKACAYVSLRPNGLFDFDTMIDFLEKQGIAKRKYPEHLEVLPELPKTPSGKIQKHVLREDIARKVGLPPVDVGEKAGEG